MIPLFERFMSRYGALGGGLLLWQAAPAAILAAGALAVETHVSDIRERERAIARGALVSELSAARARLEGEVNATLYRMEGLIAYVAIHPDIDGTEFRRLAREIVRDSQHIRSVALAPDNVVRFVHPPEPSRAVVGLDYRSVPEQWPSVEQAMQTGRTVVTGPVRLVQGGTAIIARRPIRALRAPDDGNSDERYYWGLASIVMSDKSLIDESLRIPGFDGRVALRTGADVVYGDPALFQTDSVRMPVQVPGDGWEIAALPPEGSSALLVEEVRNARFLGYGFLAVVVAVSVLLAVSHRRRLRDSLHDALTGLANRRLLFARLEVLVPMHLRRGGQLYLFFVDLDKFKPVNDRFGHAAGDRLLVDIGRRLRRNTRQTDTVARTGGDEFVIAMPDVEGDEAARHLAEKLECVVTEPFVWRGHEITVGCSVGWACMPRDAEDPDDLMNVADKRMYDIKQRKRQRG